MAPSHVSNGNHPSDSGITCLGQVRDTRGPAGTPRHGWISCGIWAMRHLLRPPPTHRPVCLATHRPAGRCSSTCGGHRNMLRAIRCPANAPSDSDPQPSDGALPTDTRCPPRSAPSWNAAASPYRRGSRPRLRSPRIPWACRPVDSPSSRACAMRPRSTCCSGSVPAWSTRTRARSAASSPWMSS